MLPGFVYKGPDNPALPATVTAANNGTSLSGTTVQLGNATGGVAATLLDAREIPFGGQSLTFHDNANDDQVLFNPFAGFHVAVQRVSTNAALLLSPLIGMQIIAPFNATPLSLTFVDTSGLTGGFSITPNAAGAGFIISQSAGQTFITDDVAGDTMLWGFNVPTPLGIVHLPNADGSDHPPLIIEPAAAVTVTMREGAIENVNGDLNFARTGVRYILAKTLTATAALNFPNTAAQTSSDLTIALAGAADGDVVALGVPIAALNADSDYSAFVSAANVVTVRFNNYSAGAIDPASGTFRVSILKY